METTTLHSLASSLEVIAWIFIICGILAIAFALFFLLIIRYSFFKGLGIVLLTTAGFQIGYGCYLLNNCTDRHISDTGIFTWTSLGVLFLGSLLRSSQTFWKGVGLGAVIQGGLSSTLLLAQAGELNRYQPQVTQQAIEQTPCRKKIDECRNWYSDFS